MNDSISNIEEISKGELINFWNNVTASAFKTRKQELDELVELQFEERIIVFQRIASLVYMASYPIISLKIIKWGLSTQSFLECYAAR